ncbi:MAG: hypothetical protein H7832_04860 [Magnetococcus sp. DMHC-6]
MNILRDGLSLIWNRMQGSLFPFLEEELGELTDKHRLVVTVLEVIRIEEYIPSNYHGGGPAFKK